MHTNHRATLGRQWKGHGHGRHGGMGGRGFGGPGGPGRGARRGRMRRGDIRTALLVVLNEGPGHGYDLMSRLEEKSGGAWRPSAGSVYPTLQQLEDEGLATSSESDGKRVYTITDAGADEAQRRVDEAGGEPWADTTDGRVHPGHLFRSIGALGLAAKQIVTAGTPAQLSAAVEIVESARRQIYGILAGDAERDSAAPSSDLSGEADGQTGRA